MQSEPMPNVMDSFDGILDHLRSAPGATLTDTNTFYITAALLTAATELASVRELVEGFVDGAAFVEFTDMDDSEEFDDESVLPISTPNRPKGNKGKVRRRENTREKR